MTEEEEWKKLPTEDKVQHKAWKARAEGYQECIKYFPRWDEKSSDFSKYLGLVKKFVTDSNELNRIQGLQATLLYVTNAAVAGKTCTEVVSGITSKCFNSKPRLREAGMEVCLMYVEIDRNEQLQDELMKGFDNKQPKIVHACVETLTTALSLFGSKVISVKPLIKQTIKLVDHRDKNVRESAKSLFVEIYRWIGPAIRAPLQNINAVALKELEDEWEKVGPGAQAKQSRFMRSQQDLREKMEAKAASSVASSEGGGPEEEDAPAVDAYDLLEPVEILSKLPKNFFSQIEEKKWQERKMALEACEKLVSENPRLQPDDYADLVKALKKVLSKDTNILLVIISIKCLGGLASALRKKFQPYALVCLDGMFERFKEKKANVVVALQEAVDAVYLTTSIQSVSETVVEALAHKNPSIRCQVGLFLSRALAKTKSAAVNKALMKLFVQPLCKNIDHSSPEVREAAFQAIGSLWKLVGEAKIQPFLNDLDKLKLDKISECAGKVQIGGGKGGSGSTSVSASKSAPSKPPPSAKESRTKVNSGKPAEKSASKESTSSKSVKGGKKKPSAKQSSSAPAPVEAELSDDAVTELVLKVISEEEQKQILNNNWKERLAGLQAAFQQIRILEKKDIPCQAFVKLLSIKPGWKDTNFNCLIEKFKLLAFLAENGNFSKTSANLCLLPTADKIADVKGGPSSKAALTAISEATEMPWVAEQVLGHAMGQKNPKIQSETLGWLSQAVCDFGIVGFNVKLLIEKIKVALAASNPVVRNAAFALIGTLTMFMGEKIRMFFESEKPALLQQIDAEMNKVKGQTPPAPCRGVKKSGAAAEAGDGEDEDEGQDGGFNLDDMMPRADISDKITDALVGKLNDKNWKVRKEGLDNVIEILNEAKFISANLGDLPVALKARLSDSNKILVTTTINILTQLSTSLGPHTAKHVSVLSANIIGALADSKPQVRQAALKCLNTWLENSKLSLWLEGDTIATALSNPKHTFLRIELFNWLTEKLLAAKKQPSGAREGLEMCIANVYACCEDRSGEIRAKAQAFLPALMRHLTYEKLVRATGKLSAQSKTVISPLLDKAKEQLPAPAAPTKSSSSTSSKPPAAPSSRQPPPPTDEPSEQPPKEGSTSSRTERKRSSKKEDSKKRQPSVTRKSKQVEEDTSPMFIPLPNGKEQRMKEEAKLKTIKWHFNVPREELVTQLQQQLATCIGSTLMGELFHADFQHHLKAISMLNQALTSDWNSTVGCIDILLRWFTLRFYDKNTTVHIKSLEYLKALFEKLIENDYRMSEYEASAFLPHLMIKIGESKDNIRKAVQGIIKQISLVYSSSKLFIYIMDGIKSKNSRQRSECLDQIGLLIETYGVGVCQPSPSKALKEIAANISDRDKGVRSAALNALVAAYNVSGEIVYKQVGRLNEKDMSMLEERIKRSGKYVEGGSVPASKPERIASAPTASGSSKTMKETKSLPVNLSHEAASLEKSQSAPEPQELLNPNSGLKKWIPDHILEGISQLKDIDIDHLLKPLPVPEFIKAQAEKKTPTLNATTALEVSISQIASTNASSSITAVHEIFEVLRRKENHDLLANRMEQLLTSSITQIRMITDRYLPYVAKKVTQKGTGDDPDAPITLSCFQELCRTHSALLFEIFTSRRLCSQFSFYSLFDFLRTIVPLMVNDNYAEIPGISRLIQILNMLILKIIDHTDPTAATCAFFRLLEDSMESGVPNYFEVSMKCIWKLARQIPNLSDPPTINGFRLEPLKVAPILAELDRLWVKYPRNHEVYTRLNSDMPLRCIKTVVLTLCKQPVYDMLDELHMISNSASEVVVMVEKAVGKKRSSHSATRSLVHKKENLGGTPTMSLEIKLAGIFKKIGDRQLTKQVMPKTLKMVFTAALLHPALWVSVKIQHRSGRERWQWLRRPKGLFLSPSRGDSVNKSVKLNGRKLGLAELYDFKRNHPSYDVDSQIDALEVEFFREYVKRSLRKLDEEEKFPNGAKPVPLLTLPEQRKHNDECIARLNRLRANCGLEPINREELKKRSSTGESTDIRTSKVLASNTSSLNFSQPPTQRVKSATSLPKAGAAPTPSSGPSGGPAASSSLLDLKRRLEQIKQNRL